ncbi:hypothetical protein PN36_11150 [Candidatus Thiomargarita nelsonii]|uniref:GmrSD restriction endonucleases N-terminal domain-containing protein n=1 Tax=Candidatus Thiomargarita nelsonii TaxID=1003181 RepID=A0A0A6S1V3_9GAMM|nr:hypothetical protein PN36_11150 [Candidatus Thiomargarita nelsonii]
MNNQNSEIEDIDNEENLENERQSNEIFDPREIDISVEQQNIDYLIGKLEDGEIDLNTEFQRSTDLWDDGKMSRLIESLMVRFPVPGFYFDITDKNNWQVIDGLQRLSALKKFVIDNKLKLKGLDFLQEIEGKTFNDLSSDQVYKHLIRTMKRTQIVLYLIRPGTPKAVKYRLYERINTGGLTLNSQEIRHALNQGIAANYVEELSQLPEFKKVIIYSTNRMLDREFVLRYIAFREISFYNYKLPFTKFLDNAMENIAKCSRREKLKQEFAKALETAYQIFDDKAFRKKPRAKSNGALFETWTVNLSQLTDEKRVLLVSNKAQVIELFNLLLTNHEDFKNSISKGFSTIKGVKTRFIEIEQLIQNVLDNPNIKNSND